MTNFQPPWRKHLIWTALNTAFALFFGFMGALVLWFILFDLGWTFLLFGLPFMLFKLAVILDLDRFARWRRSNAPLPPPSRWRRHHALSIGASMALWQPSFSCGHASCSELPHDD